MMEVALALLGHRMRDKITGQVGVVTSVCFDLYGCVQATLHPGMTTEGKIHEQFWFDIARLDLLDEPRVMEPPPRWIGDKGPAEKPAPRGI